MKRSQRTDSKPPFPIGVLPGVGTVLGGGAGAVLGVALSGGPGIAMGIVIGAGLGLLVGTVIWTLSQSRRP